ncbi:hypothetical protein [Mesorhizobium sp. M0488]|uniref:hypothetical protein n=1 Tax=unclassified Mesorhizobium TaxID=325217 RepID=UPI003339CEBA
MNWMTLRALGQAFNTVATPIEASTAHIQETETTPAASREIFAEHHGSVANFSERSFAA